MNVYIPSSGFATQGPCDDGFHVPLDSEWTNVYNIWTALGGGSSDGTNFGIALKLPFAGNRDGGSSNVVFQGSRGYYWSSTYYDSSNSYGLRILSSYIFTSNQNRQTDSLSIRPFKNSKIVPTSSWTKLYGTSIESGGIFWSSIDGLISLSSDGTNWITIADKNLGATTVWNNGDTLSEANCGKYYQRGNNNGFAWIGSVTTSSTKVNAGSYGPGNYYSSSTFITVSSSPYNWDSSNNTNLRGGVDGNVPVTTMKEVQNIYIGEYVKPDYLCFTANTAGSTIKLNKTGSPTAVTLETSTDGESWSTYTFGTTITLSNVGDKVYWRNTSETDTGFSLDNSNKYQFVMTGSISAEGDTNYLLNKNSTTTVSDYCFYQLFSGCTYLTTAPLLPATTLGDRCYYNMFRNCGITKAPTELPATTATTQCYYSMFYGCGYLTTAPSLPATTLATECYSNMFQGCSNLEQLPALPALTQTYKCYNNMFRSCSKIKLSTSKTGEYQTAYRVPTTGTGTTGSDSMYYMFYQTGGTFTSDPTINTTYYTSNTVV